MAVLAKIAVRSQEIGPVRPAPAPSGHIPLYVINPAAGVQLAPTENLMGWTFDFQYASSRIPPAAQQNARGVEKARAFVVAD